MIIDKYEAAGNDFLIITSMEKYITLSKESIVRLCDRRKGIGADGVIIMEKSSTCDFKMRFYNNDGSGGMFCGNGGRAIVDMANRLNLPLKEENGNRYKFEAPDGIHFGSVWNTKERMSNVRISLNDVKDIQTIDILENESECLKKLLDEPNEIPVEVQTAIKIRIEMLNSLLASHITNNYQYENSYDNWVKELTNNIDEFMNSNRLAFKASHPQFIQYFENHGLDNNEINYICLYAIGLKGKEVGNYIRKPSHVNLSSAIRKKLGIDKHETNIGIYVRRLLKSL